VFGAGMRVMFKGTASMLCSSVCLASILYFEVYLMFSLMVALTKYSAKNGVE
jgi:hypothetical protein